MPAHAFTTSPAATAPPPAAAQTTRAAARARARARRPPTAGSRWRAAPSGTVRESPTFATVSRSPTTTAHVSVVPAASKVARSGAVTSAACARDVRAQRARVAL